MGFLNAACSVCHRWDTASLHSGITPVCQEKKQQIYIYPFISENLKQLLNVQCSKKNIHYKWCGGKWLEGRWALVYFRGVHQQSFCYTTNTTRVLRTEPTGLNLSCYIRGLPLAFRYFFSFLHESNAVTEVSSPYLSTRVKTRLRQMVWCSSQDRSQQRMFFMSVHLHHQSAKSRKQPHTLQRAGLALLPLITTVSLSITITLFSAVQRPTVQYRTQTTTHFSFRPGKDWVMPLALSTSARL